MGKIFKEEISYLPNAIGWAAIQDVTYLKRSIQGISSRSLYAIGSGGSFTIAAYAAACHEKRFGQMSRAVSPLEYFQSGSRVPQAASLLLSAEGKNRDILLAARSTLIYEHPSLALVLKLGTPLSEFAKQSGGISTADFDMPWGKDGYLATNSLVAMTIILSKAYGKDIPIDSNPFSYLDLAWICRRRERIATVIQDYSVGTQIIVLFSDTSHVAAIDLESKFAEATLGTCQLADYRQFAHGRHLQLENAKNSIVIAFKSPKDNELAAATLALLPKNSRQLILDVPDDAAAAVVQGIIDAILITDVVADHLQIDPSSPKVPQFCRDIHQLNVSELVEERLPTVPLPIYRKLKRENGNTAALKVLETAAQAYINKIANAKIKALVCDFDGTFCETDKRFQGLDTLLIEDFQRIASHGIPIVFATGRGDSLYEDLRRKIDNRYWKNIYIGYYSGSYIAPLDQKPAFPDVDSRFDNLFKWMDEIGLNARIEAKAKMDCGQLSLRCGNNAFRHEAVTAIKLWIKEQEQYGWRVYCSGHSIDVLSDRAGKRKVVDFVVEKFGIDPQTELIRLGDSGDFDGNDYELLCEGLSLSVNTVSTDPSSCWNFLPIDKRGVVGTHYYLKNMLWDSHNKSISIASLFDLQGKEVG